MEQVTFFYTGNHNPWRNLACEEYLFDRLQRGEAVLYLWQNDRTVVIGANQNPLAEVNLDALKRDGGKLARRLSGGGAVYHDLGNLNFTFIVERKYYDFARQVGVIVEALKNLGISAEFSGRNDILVEGQKISGNAFYFREDRALHHGTILLATDFAQLAEYLNVDSEKIQAKGIKSVRSRVANLRDFVSELKVEDVVQALKDAFRVEYETPESTYREFVEAEIDVQELADLTAKYSAWEFRYGRSPAYELQLKKRFAWGGVDLNFDVDRGKIQAMQIYSDAMDHELSGRLTDKLLGRDLVDLPELAGTGHAEDREVIDWLVEELKI